MTPEEFDTMTGAHQDGVEPVEASVVLTQDRSTGVIHRRVRLAGHLASLEGCNLDDAGAYDVIPSIGASTQPFRFCQRCAADLA